MCQVLIRSWCRGGNIIAPCAMCVVAYDIKTLDPACVRPLTTAGGPDVPSTGGGHDGMQGLLHVTTAGGLSLVQKPSEAEHASMPEYAIAHDHVRAELTGANVRMCWGCSATPRGPWL